MKAPSWSARYLPLLPFLLTTLVFLPALGADFVGVDDPNLVWGNPGVTGGLSLAGLKWAFTGRGFPSWHPLTWLSHQADVSLFGLSPMGHHATSVLLHALTTALAFVFFRAATGRPGRSLLVALLFGLHPLRAESVVWVSERKDVLCALFCVAAMLCHLRYRRAPGVGRWLATTACVALALMSKPMAVTLPFVLLLLDLWPLGPTAGARVWRARVLEKLPWVALALAASALTVAYQRSSGALASTPLAQRLPRVAAAYGLSLWHTVWPLHLSYFYPRVEVPAWAVALSLAAVGALVAGAWLLRARAPAFTVGALWFLGVALPTTGVMQVGGQLTADRYTYLPHLGLFAAVVFALPVVPERWLRTAALASTALVVACASLLWGQIAVWSSSDDLYPHALERDPGNARALQYLGMLRLQQQRLPEGVALLEAAARAAPDDGFVLSNLARAYADTGDAERSLATAARAVKLPCEQSQLGLVLQVYGKALARAGRPAEAEPVLRRAVELKPAIPVEVDLARVLVAQQRDDEALALFEAGAQRFPGDGRFPLEEAELCVKLGRLDQARALAGRAAKLGADARRLEALRERLR